LDAIDAWSENEVEQFCGTNARLGGVNQSPGLVGQINNRLEVFVVDLRNANRPAAYAYNGGVAGPAWGANFANGGALTFRNVRATMNWVLAVAHDALGPFTVHR